MATGSVSVLAGSYIYVQKSWWSDIASDFHFDDGSDLRYALNVDKGGHFFGGILVADLFQGSLQWAGLKEKQAYFYGGVMGSFVQLGIEMKDMLLIGVLASGILVQEQLVLSCPMQNAIGTHEIH